MLIRRVVDDQVDDDANAKFFGLACKVDKVAECAVARVDAIEILDVVAVVTARRRVEGQQPHTGNAAASKVRQVVAQPKKIAHAVGIAISKSAHVQAVDNSVFVPEVDQDGASHKNNVVGQLC